MLTMPTESSAHFSANNLEHEYLPPPYLEIQPGLSLALTHSSELPAAKQDMISFPGDQDFLHLNCILQGNFKAHIKDQAMFYSSGDINMGYSDGEVFHMPADQEFCNLAIMATPEQLWQLAGEELTALNMSEQPHFFVRNAGKNRKAAQAAQQLALQLQQGDYSKLRLHSAVLDYIYWHLTAFKDDNSKDSIYICPREKRQLLEAKEYLLSDLSQPPTIAEIAKQMGMNQCKLKKGFKEMFGSSIYALFQQERMKSAMTLLSKHNVTETAMLLGYSNVSHFSAAFRKQFGLLPREAKRDLAIN